MKEKLIELIHSAKCEIDTICEGSLQCNSCPADVYGWKCKAGYIADHLIANGVVIPVRCKDCVHYKPLKPYPSYNGHTNYCCRGANVRVSDNDFCSFGERKI